MISLNDVLLAMSNIPVDDPIAEIWGRGLQGGYRIIEYTGTLPVTINANGDALIDYRIYGASGGVGAPTENLYNKNDPDIVFSAYIDWGGTIRTGGYGNAVKVSGYIPINGGQTYTGTNLMDSGSGNFYAYYNTNKQLLRTGLVANNMVFNPPINAAYIRTTIIHRHGEDIAMLTAGSTAPTSYIPYGYKLPMVVGDGDTVQNVPVYIGDSKLGEEEYVDYGEQKVYKRTANLVNSADSESGYIDANDGLVRPSSVTKTTDYIEIDTSEDYSALLTRVGAIQSTSQRVIAYYAENKTFISYYYYTFSTDENQVTFTLQNTPNNAKYVRFSYDVAFEQITFVSGSTAPDHYIPYGVVPTDPPVPLPEIPTIDGTTVIDYDGDPKPSQMYVKYKGKG